MSTTVASTRRSTKDIFGQAAPSKNLRLPEDLIVLVTEFVVYFPKSLHNYHALMRFIQNGLDQKTIANMVNSHRKWEKHPAITNSLCHLLKNEMREGLGGEKDWTVTKHKAGLFTYDYKWDEEDLTLNGIMLNCELQEGLSVESIPFADLARDVQVHPSYSRGDGFLLTRCVQYAAAHPDKGYIFPHDFTYLVEMLDDGRELNEDHLDAASIKRWKNKKTWEWEANPETESFKDLEDFDDKADENDVVMQEGNQEEFADAYDPLDLLNNSTTSQEDPSSSYSYPQISGNQHKFAPSDRAIAAEDGFVAGLDNVNLFTGHGQGYHHSDLSQYPNPMYNNYLQGIPLPHDKSYSEVDFSWFDTQPGSFMYPPPDHQQAGHSWLCFEPHRFGDPVETLATTNDRTTLTSFQPAPPAADSLYALDNQDASESIINGFIDGLDMSVADDNMWYQPEFDLWKF